jgi:glycosyltransferase involved in cell wall biosynthesis
VPHATLLAYRLDQPSFRYRMQTLIGPLERAGWTVGIEKFPSGRYGLRIWERRELLRRSTVVVLHQIKLAAAEARLLGRFAPRLIFDYDDAIYVRRPRRLGEPADESRWRRLKFAATCKAVTVVAPGNDVLAAAAAPYAHRIVTLPTALDVSRYRASTLTQDDPPTIVWIGNPENLIYLEILRPALARLTERHRSLRLRIICSSFLEWPDVRTERVLWSPQTEVDSLAGSHIGVMPLSDDEWSRGKCAFKLLQYMAASLPCVASPVGANTEAVVAEQTGLHARTTDEWEQALERLIGSPALRARFGAAGRAHVETRYGLQGYQARYVDLFKSLAD